MPCAVAEPVEGLATGLLILLLPVLLTLPLRFGWKWWVVMEPEHEHYREKVRRVLDSGIPIKRYRTELDSVRFIETVRTPALSSFTSSDFLPSAWNFRLLCHYYTITDVQTN